MTEPSDPRNPPARKRGLDRRSLLIGGAVGAGGAAAVAVGAGAVKAQFTPLIAPEPVAAGEPPRIAQSYADSRPVATDRAGAPAGAPNIVVIVLDDVGFADLGCFGGEIATPAIDALAGAGLRYANFRTTAMCSPTRASLLTGLNHHNAGMGWLADVDSGYPGYRGDLTLDAATLPEVLRGAGWNTFLVGKWHVNFAGDNGPAGPFHNWPTNRGFEHAYWFQGHSTDYFRPGAMFDGTTLVDLSERTANGDYYVTDDLAERAAEYIRTQQSVAAGRPFYLQLAFSGAHSPLQALPADRDAYRGRYDRGWDAVRAERLAKQKALGIVPGDTVLPPLSKGAEPWDTLSPEQHALYARYMEVYAGTVAGVDRGVGTVLKTLDELGIRDNTIVVLMSDNGGSPEGTPTGTPNLFATAMGRAVPLEAAARLAPIMGENGTFPHYPMGWANASNTPFRLYKQFTALGGVADPLIVSWPARITDKGAIRRQFVHVIDLYPTLLEATGVERPAVFNGRTLKPVDGRSVAATFTAPAAATRSGQYFELGGYRAYEDGRWRLVAQHERGKPFDDDIWELYDLAADPSEHRDVAADHPAEAARLRAAWDSAARRYQVYPLDDRPLIVKLYQQRTKDMRPRWEFRPPVPYLPVDASPLVCGLDHAIELVIDRPERADGVLIAHGSAPAGYALYILNGELFYTMSVIPWAETFSGGPVPAGRSTIRYEQAMKTRPYDGTGTLLVNGVRRATHKFERTISTPSYDGLSIGRDFGNYVSSAYSGPAPFAGTIEHVTFDITNRRPTLEEMRAFLAAIQIRV